MPSCTLLQPYSQQQPKPEAERICQSSDFSLGMATNVQVFPTFDGMNSAAESDFVSELEEVLREILLFL